MKKILLILGLALLLSCEKAEDEVGCYVCEELWPTRLSLVPMNWNWEMLDTLDIEGWSVHKTDIYCDDKPMDGELNGKRAPVKYECERF